MLLSSLDINSWDAGSPYKLTIHLFNGYLVKRWKECCVDEPCHCRSLNSTLAGRAQQTQMQMPSHAVMDRLGLHVAATLLDVNL